MNLFFDTSAFIKRYVEESGSEEVEKLCNSADDIGVSILLPVEAISTLSRLKREKRLSLDQYNGIKKEFFLDIRDVTMIPLTPSVVKTSIDCLERSALKALDSLHIGCALEYRPDFFISSDNRQLFAAAKAGLKIMKAR